MDALVKLVETVPERPTDRGGEIRQAGPIDGRLKGVECVARIPQRIAEVGCPEAARDPASAERATNRDPALAADESRDLANRRFDDPFWAAGADEQE